MVCAMDSNKCERHISGQLNRDELWHGGPQFINDSGVFRLGTDSVLLADFTNTAKAKRAVDLGCGSGIISIILSWNNPEMFIDSVEIDPRAAGIAAENAKINRLSARMTVTTGDLRDHRELFTAGAYDLTVSNPPYFAKGHGKQSSIDGLKSARSEEFCTLSDVCKAAMYLTRWGGIFALVHRPQRLSEIFAALSESGFEPKRMRFVQHMAKSPPSLVLIESRRGGNPSLTIEAPLILANDDGSDSAEVCRIYRRHIGN